MNEDTYISVDDADAYFANKLNISVWDNSSVENKTKALLAATRNIDRLNFVGIKTIPTQNLEFPRGTDLIVPDDIKIACCEIALSLLSGINIEKEIENLSVEVRGFQGVRTQWDRSFIPEHLKAGIVSIVAWQYLVPYLRDQRSIAFRKID